MRNLHFKQQASANLQFTVTWKKIQKKDQTRIVLASLFQNTDIDFKAEWDEELRLLTGNC